MTHTVRANDGKLLLRVRPAPEVQMEPTYADAFRVNASTVSTASFIEFTRDAAGKVVGFEVSTGRFRRLRFLRSL